MTTTIVTVVLDDERGEEFVDESFEVGVDCCETKTVSVLDRFVPRRRPWVIS